jgi:hypothetical protein
VERETERLLPSAALTFHASHISILQKPDVIRAVISFCSSEDGHNEITVHFHHHHLQPVIR